MRARCLLAVALSTSIGVLAATREAAAVDMQGPGTAVRCSNWSWWSPIWMPDPWACGDYCDANGADACEYYENGDCYVEWGSSCYLEGGHGGWWGWIREGAPPPPPPGDPPAGYVGCYTDDGNRALPVSFGGGHTIESCIAAVAGSGYAYAGLQWYGECWGGNAVGYDAVGDWECNTPCDANPGQMCGGGWRNSIYATGAGGCNPTCNGCGTWNGCGQYCGDCPPQPEPCTWLYAPTRVTNAQLHDVLVNRNPDGAMADMGFYWTHVMAVQHAGAEGVRAISEQVMDAPGEHLLDGYFCPEERPLSPFKLKYQMPGTIPMRWLDAGDASYETLVAPQVIGGCPRREQDFVKVPYMISSFVNHQFGATCTDHLADQCGWYDRPTPPVMSPAEVDQTTRALWQSSYGACREVVDHKFGFEFWCDGDAWDGAYGLDDRLCMEQPNDEGRDCLCTRMANQAVNEMAFGSGWVSHANLVYRNIPGLGGTGAPPVVAGNGSNAPEQVLGDAAAHGHPPYVANFAGAAMVCVPNSQLP